MLFSLPQSVSVLLLANLLIIIIAGASLVAQMVKNPPAMWETWIRFDPWVGKFPWRRGHGSPLQYSGLEDLHGQRSLAGYSPQGCRVRNN